MSSLASSRARSSAARNMTMSSVGAFEPLSRGDQSTRSARRRSSSTPAFHASSAPGSDASRA
ncbi:MAG TPA: hypothetical protein DEF51_00985 [Myxococcales bacterium]|nr:hypothetical protein [Myxococcales bacterium]